MVISNAQILLHKCNRYPLNWRRISSINKTMKFHSPARKKIAHMPTTPLSSGTQRQQFPSCLRVIAPTLGRDPGNPLNRTNCPELMGKKNLSETWNSGATFASLEEPLSRLEGWPLKPSHCLLRLQAGTYAGLCKKPNQRRIVFLFLYYDSTLTELLRAR